MGRGRGIRRRRSNVVWDVLQPVQSNLPLLTLDNVNGGVDGAFTSLRRYRGADVTLLRIIFQMFARVRQLGNQVDATSMLEICVGLSPFDSMGDVAGQAFNTTLAVGTGPLSDADNSRWMARCCVLIPIGKAVNFAGITENQVYPMISPRSGPHSGYWTVLGNTTPANIEWDWYCEWDSKTKRKLQGAETSWLQLAMEAKLSVVPAVGDDVTVAMDAFSGRLVKTSAGLPE